MTVCLGLIVFFPVWFICRLFTLEPHHSSRRFVSWQRASFRITVSVESTSTCANGGVSSEEEEEKEEATYYSHLGPRWLRAVRALCRGWMDGWVGGWGARRTLRLESEFNHFSAALNWLAASSPVSQVREATRLPHQGSNQLNCRMHFGKRSWFFFLPLFSTGAF